MTQLVSHSPRSTLWGVPRPGRLRWVGLLLPRLPLGPRALWREPQPCKFRWVLALLLATVLILVMGEFGPAASAIAARL